ncbi:protein FAM13A-like [Danio rerio]|uniref:Protein FAM13A-like n=1 Tax=Danio rerio TaxID=7955 RepID=A0AC58I0V5_DANRE
MNIKAHFKMGVLSVCDQAQSKVVGVPLSNLRKNGQMRQGLPLALTHLVGFLEKHGLNTSGLFRVGGTQLRHHELRKCFDKGGFPKLNTEDVHSSASALKLFLSVLPGGLIPEPHMIELLEVFMMFLKAQQNLRNRRSASVSQSIFWTTSNIYSQTCTLMHLSAT